jgi:transcriptional regulator with PAS, ATPase and Fis domain
MTSKKLIDAMKAEVTALQTQLHEQNQITEKYQQSLKEIQEREAYNFALFQFNPFYIVVVDRDGRVIKSNSAKQHSGARLPNIGDIMYKDYASKHSINMHAALMECIRSGSPRTFPDMRYDDKYLAITISPFPDGALIISQDITDVKRVELERINLIRELQTALHEIETLRGLLPICACCKRIRKDGGYWQEIEEYFRERSHLDFSHTMCPACVQRVYPDVWERMEQSKRQEHPIS